MPAPSDARRLDLVRQISVICAFSFMIIGCLVGVGLFGGTPIPRAQDGAFAPDASLLTPAGPAFAIWTPIYLGLLGYTVWQALPSGRSSARHRGIGWWIALTMVLNGAWLVAVQFASIGVSVGIIVVLLAALAAALVRVVRTSVPRAGVVDKVLADGVTGLHVGWVTVATVANVAAAITATARPQISAPVADGIGVAVVGAVAALGLATAWCTGWRVTPGVAAAWGLVWLAVARLAGEPRSVAIGVAAIVAAVLLVSVPVAVAGLRLVRPQGD